MATRTVPKSLGEAVEAVSSWSRSSRHRHRTPATNRTNGCGESVVARAQDSWRAENARHRHLRALRIPPFAKASPAAEPDMEDFLHRHAWPLCWPPPKMKNPYFVYVRGVSWTCGRV